MALAHHEQCLYDEVIKFKMKRKQPGHSLGFEIKSHDVCKAKDATLTCTLIKFTANFFSETLFIKKCTKVTYLCYACSYAHVSSNTPPHPSSHATQS